MEALASYRKAVVSFVVVASMIFGALFVGVAAASPTNAPSTPASATATSTATPSTPAAAVSPSYNAGPHPGTLDVYEVSPAGANTEDPAVAYDTVSYEPILNVYETLINYNGSSTSTYVPTLATCVPGTVQCVTDYGSNLTGYVSGKPTYWTFVIDPAAKFYDPGYSTSWSVYPSDVMFSIARTLAFADLPYAGKSPGWIIAQSLLPFGSPSYDNGIHFPYNNTPQRIYDSMLINDSTYCPASAMNGVLGHGCITFVANGSSQDWPFFLELAADNLGASVVPCGWFTAQSAGLPGWNGSGAAHGDGPCLLPNGGNNTNGAGWSNYVAAQAPASWDALQRLELSPGWPAPQPNVQWSMVGSGPYYASVSQGTGYQLAASAGYAEPSGCTGGPGGTTFAKYTGYCDPAASGYIPRVNVFWEPDDSFGISQYQSGQADFAGIETTHTTTLLSLNASGKLRFFGFPTLSSFFTPINLAWNTGAYSTDFPTQPVPNIPSNFFSNLAMRQLYVMSFPYTTVQNTVNTISGVTYQKMYGGPIPYGMGSYYPGPANVTFPYEVNGGNVQTNPTVVGGAAWWWAQATNPTSPYYDAQAAACTPTAPCTWAIAGLQGFPAGDISIGDWIAEIKSITSGALQPFGGSSFDLTFPQFLDYAFASPYTSPLVSEAGTGWAPDYPDPTDYMTPMFLPTSTYTGPDTFAQQLALPAFNNSTACGHSTVTQANLIYWAQQANFTYGNDTFLTACQGVAYYVASNMAVQAGAMKEGPARIAQYTLIEKIANALAMYVYNGQTNEITSYAPWISQSSINQNPMIGGGGDNIWYQIRYAGAETSVNFTETGLPAATTWKVTLGSETLSSSTGKITFPNQVNGTFPYSVEYISGYNVTPASGTVTIAGSNITQAVTFAAMATPLEHVYFNETGLVSNTTWGISIKDVGSLLASGPSIEFNLTNTAIFNVTPTPLAQYNVSPVSENITVVGTTQVPIAYTNIIESVYSLTFASTGLPAGQSWTVTVSGPKIGSYSLTSTAADITFYEVGGNFSAAFAVPATVQAPSRAIIVDLTGNMTVSVPLTATAKAFDLTFTETGLAASTAWNISVTNATLGIANFTQSTTSASMTFKLANGSYAWAWQHIDGWVASVATGTATVNGATVNVAITFTQYTYAVTFHQSGLPSGGAWSISINGGTPTGSTSYTLTVQLPNGTAQYTASVPAGYEVLPAQNGSVTVTGATASVTLTYVPIFSVSFTETGLPSGKSWSVYFAGLTKSATGATIAFAVANGTWSYGVGVPSGYLATPSGGQVTVNGAARSVAVAISPSSTAASPSSNYLGTLAYAIIAGLAVLAVIGLMLAAVFARRRPPASPPPKDWAPEKTTDKSETEGGMGSSSQNPPPPSG